MRKVSTFDASNGVDPRRLTNCAPRRPGAGQRTTDIATCAPTSSHCNECRDGHRACECCRSTRHWCVRPATPAANHTALTITATTSVYSTTCQSTAISSMRGSVAAAERNPATAAPAINRPTPAPAIEKQRLDEQLHDHPRSRRAKRQAHRHLLPAMRRSLRDRPAMFVQVMAGFQRHTAKQPQGLASMPIVEALVGTTSTPIVRSVSGYCSPSCVCTTARLARP